MTFRGVRSLFVASYRMETHGQDTMSIITYVDLAEQIQAILDVKERTAKSYIKFMREKEIIRKDPSNQSYYIIGNLKQAGL